MKRSLITVATTCVFSLMTFGANANLIVNSSFEDTVGSVVYPVGTGKPGPGAFFVYTSVTGWSAVPSQSTTVPFELQNNISGIGPAKDGDLHLELDALTNSRVRQTVSTVAGQTYEFSFWYSPRPAVEQDSNAVAVFWDGGLLDTVFETGIGITGTIWTLQTYQVIASGTSTDIDFAGTGPADLKGGLIDVVSLVAVAGPGAPVPEPATLFLFGFALAGIAATRRKRAR